MKFQVGDKVRVTGDSLFGELRMGEIGTVSDTNYMCYDKVTRILVDFEDDINGLFRPEKLQLVETKKSKNQRITALEKEVADLKLIVEDLRERKAIEKVEPATPQSIANWIAKPKSPNQQRAEIIEKAKRFVEESKQDTSWGSRSYFVPIPGVLGCSWVCNLKFEVNEKKRSVTALLYWKPEHAKVAELKAKSIAKCHPNAVFNEHIGKAIALGRALGLDVSEFEQAAQPSEVVVGMTIRRKFWDSDETYLREVKKVKGEYMDYECGGYDSSIHPQDNLTIINDTNAQYEEVK